MRRHFTRLNGNSDLDSGSHAWSAPNDQWSLSIAVAPQPLFDVGETQAAATLSTLDSGLGHAEACIDDGYQAFIFEKACRNANFAACETFTDSVFDGIFHERLNH